jgi:enoyl-CoA hydratase
VIDVYTQDHVAVVRMEHGKANALDVELMRDLSGALQGVRHSQARAVVLTGTGGIFGAGVDLFRVLSGGDAYASEFVPGLARFLVELFEYPLPLVAAVNGHAIAGGCIVACACDYRIMAEGKGTIGVPELLVGVPFPAAAIEIMRFAVPPHELQALIYTGRACGAEEAARRGLVNETVSADQLLDRARQVAQQLARVPPAVFAGTKQALRTDVLARLRADRTLDDVVRHWASAETRAHIQQYLDRVVKKQP